MDRSAVVELSSAGCASRLARRLLCGLLLAAVVAGSTACRAPMRGQCPLRALAPSRDLKGTVLGPDGEPVAGAQVEVYEAQPKYLYGPDVLSKVGRQRTGPDGIFHFLVGQDATRVHVVATHKDLGLGWTCWQTAQTNHVVVVQMSQPAPLAGRVVDHQGKPVSGALVAISMGKRFLDYANLGSRVPGLAARTDKDGRFRFQGLPADQAVQFEVTAAGHGKLDTVRTQDEGYMTGQTDVELKMPEAAIVEAVVVSKKTGKPVPNVPVILWSRSLAREMIGTPVPGKPGHVRWTDIAPGGVAMFVATPFKGPAPCVGTITQAEPKAGQATQVKVEVMSGQIVEILARDAATGAPIQGFQGGMFDPQAKTGGIGRSGRDGIARLRVAPGEYQHVGGDAPLYRDYRRQDPVKVEAGKPCRLEVKLDRLPSYHGTVLGPEGKPMPGATVAIFGDYAAHTITDASGAFELYPLFYDTDRTPTVTMIARHVGSGLATAMEVPSPEKPIQVRLQGGAAREVTVVDADDKPIGGAEVLVTYGQYDVRPEGGRFVAFTDATGKCTVKALPMGQPLALCVQASGYVAQAKLLPAMTAETASAADRVQLKRVQRLTTGPAVKEIAIPATDQEDSIWGAEGRDSRGHIWFAVSKHNRPNVSTDLFEFIPETNQIINCGNAVDQLKRLGLAKPDQQQMKIHSKIYEVDGYLYFVSMDEKGEDEQKLIQPVFGSHLWRLRLSDNTWEHLLTIPEAMVSIAVGGGKVYTLGYWHHMLYQYDIATGAEKHVKVGTCFGHVSRNVIADSRGHVYVPRCGLSAGMPTAALVEFDEQLKEIASTPLPLYYHSTPNGSYGLTALQPLPDGSIAILTHNGWLTIIHPQENGPAKLEHLGWFHPDGPDMADSLFLDKTGRYLMGAVMHWIKYPDWVTYDLQTGERTVAPLTDGDPEHPSWERSYTYGCQTQDDQGNCYLVGFAIRKDKAETRPLLLQVNPNGRQKVVSNE